MHIQVVCIANAASSAHKMHTKCTPSTGNTKSAYQLVLATLQKEFPFGVQRSDGTLCLFWCTEKPHSMVHWASNSGPAPHHLHGRHRELDEDGRQDQDEEDKQPSIVRRQHPQGQHGGGGGDPTGARPGRDRYALRVHRCCIARCCARFAREGLKHCADFAHQKKRVQSVHIRFLQTLQTRVKCA
jgi:hypothetical protein